MASASARSMAPWFDGHGRGPCYVNRDWWPPRCGRGLNGYYKTVDDFLREVFAGPDEAAKKGKGKK